MATDECNRRDVADGQDGSAWPAAHGCGRQQADGNAETRADASRCRRGEGVREIGEQEAVAIELLPATRKSPWRWEYGFREEISAEDGRPDYEHDEQRRAAWRRA